MGSLKYGKAKDKYLARHCRNGNVIGQLVSPHLGHLELKWLRREKITRTEKSGITYICIYLKYQMAMWYLVENFIINNFNIPLS